MLLAILSGLVAAVVLLLTVAGRTAHARAAQAAQPPAPPLNAEIEVIGSGVSALNASVIQTWTHTTGTDWEAGTLEWLDSATVSGSLQLAQRYFSANATVTPRSGLASRQTDPDIAVDSAGNACAVWVDYRNGNENGGGDVYFACRPAGGSWGANVKVNDTLGTVSRGTVPAIAVDGSGNAYIVWTDGRNGNADIYFAYCPAGGACEPSVRVNDDAGPAGQSDPAIAVDGSGNAYAVWTDDRNCNNDIYFAYRPADGTWGANVKVNDDTGTASQGDPTIAVDSSGNAYAVWTDYRDGSAAIYTAYRPADGNWEANRRLGQGPSWQVGLGGSAAGVDGSGNAYAVWATSREGIFFAYRPAGGEWGSGVLVNDNNFEMRQQTPDIAVNPSGVAYAVWTDARYGAANTYFARLLSVPEYVPEGVHTSPELNTGVTVAVWESLIYAATVPAGTSLTFETRSRLAGCAWTEWQPLLSPIASPPGQYLQYRVTFSTTLTGVTPRLDQVQIAYRSAGTPSAPRFATPCGVTNQTAPTLRGSATAGSVVRLYVDGTEVATTTTASNGTFAFTPGLSMGSHIITATAENESGAGPASAALALTVNPALPFDPINVRAGQWSKDGWLMSVPRDATGCANPDNGWRVWPRADVAFRVEVPVSYTTSAAVTVTVGTQTITLTEGTGKVFGGIFQPPIQGGAFVIQVNADGQVATVTGGPVLIDPDGVVYEAWGTLSDTIAGVQVTLYYSDTHSGQWVMWDAWNYGQVNPQTTLDDGYYSFYTPPGIYRVVAEKAGYPVYTSPDLVVVSTPVWHNVPLGFRYRLYLPLVLKGS